MNSGRSGSKKHLFRMLAEWKQSSNEQTFPFGVTSIQIFEGKRTGMSLQSYLFIRKFFRLIFSDFTGTESVH